MFIAEVTIRLCHGNARQAEERFGWGRETVRKGLRELDHDIVIVGNFKARGRQPIEERNPQLADDIREVVEPRTQPDPELKSTRRYTNLSAGEVRRALIVQKGWREEDLPAERTLRTILNRMNYRLKRIQKGRPAEIHQLRGNDYPTGVTLTRKEMQPWEARLERAPQLPKYDITIRPLKATAAVN